MKKEYLKPEAEMMKFVEAEDIMTENNLFTADIGSTGRPEYIGL